LAEAVTRQSVVKSGLLPLRWDGGLNLALDPGYIQDNELSGGQNFIVRDGLARLDQRYIKFVERQSGSDTPRGSGWGKYGTGSQSEQYLVVLNTTMYQVDLTTTAAVSEVGGATSLNAGDWWFQQFADYMYAGNAANGLGRKKLAAGSNGTGDWTLIQLPTAPASAPVVTLGSYQSQTSFAGSSIAHTYGSGFSETQEANGRWKITYSAAGVDEVTVTFDTSPDLRPNLQYNDVIGIPDPGGTIPEIYIISSGTAIKAIYWRRDPDERTPGARYLYYRLQNIARGSRTTVDSIKYVFTIPTNDVTIFYASAPRVVGGVWLSLDSGTNPGSGLPTFKELVYEYTYYNSTTGLESAPSPQKIIGAAEQDPNGEWRVLTTTTTAQSGVDKIRFYRVVTESGLTTRYRIAEVNNASTPSTTDKYPLEEIKAFTVFTPSVLPSSGITGISAWQNRLVLAVGVQVYISRDGSPLVFEQQGAAFDVLNPARGLTFYPDDKRGEEIIAIVGQDDLYMVSRYSVRALIGNSPDNWRLLKLPDSEGACGPRAVAAYKKGILVLTVSGKLMYHHSSLPEPMEVSVRVRKRIGASNIAALATSDASIAVWPDGEVMISNSTGAYMILDTDGVWRQGTWSHGIHSILSVPGVAKRWIGSNGKFYETGSDSYVSDGGTSGTNGTAVTWYIETKRYMIGRSGMRNVFWGDSTESPSVSPTYPRLTPTIDGSAMTALVKADNKRNKGAALATYKGSSFKYRITGDKDTVVDRCEIKMTTLSEGEHL
jgi:hypothetical protein